MTIAQISLKRIAIVDDEKNLAEATGWDVEEAGFEPAIVDGYFSEVDRLAAHIAENYQGALCDHRLANYGLTNFSGAKLVAALYDRKIPSILTTQYAEIDASLSIRKFRRKIPVLLSRDKANAATIKKGIEDCVLEFNGQVPSNRKPYRTLVRITQIDRESGEDVVDAIVPGWHPHKAVRFPAILIPEAIRQDVLKAGVRLFARVNIGAEKSEDLYFDKFQLAPELNENDELT
jgi:hypothetical protein